MVKQWNHWFDCIVEGLVSSLSTSRLLDSLMHIKFRFVATNNICNFSLLKNVCLPFLGETGMVVVAFYAPFNTLISCLYLTMNTNLRCPLARFPPLILLDCSKKATDCLGAFA